MFSRREFGQVAHHGSQAFRIQGRFVGEALAQLSIRSQAQDGISIFWIVVSDAFHGTGQSIHEDKYTRRGTHFTSGRMRLTAYILWFIDSAGTTKQSVFHLHLALSQKGIEDP